MAKCILAAGEVIIVRSGVNTGDIAVVPESLAGSYAAYDLIVRLRENVLPEYLVFFFSTSHGRTQFDIRSGRAAQAHLNAEDVSSAILPLPRKSVQAALVKDLQAARSARDAKLAQAEVLLNGIDDLVLAELGLAARKITDRLAYAVRLRELKSRCDGSATRFDPHYNAPRFWGLVGTLKGMPSQSLGTVVRFSNDQWNPESHNEDTFNYIEISGVDLQTGEITSVPKPTSKAPSRARMLVQAGDILISLTRPHRGAIGVVPKNLHGTVASTGFAVIRKITAKKYRPQYLLVILRSSVCLQQMLQRSSGGNYPAITESELKRITVPLCVDSVQQQIVAQVAKRKGQVRQLRAEAAALWSAALADFEAKLIGKA